MDTHLFIATGNNSGSTLLLNLLSNCKNAVTFPKEPHEHSWVIMEGQHVAQGHMPGFKLSDDGLVWTEQFDRISNRSNYDWEQVKKSWDIAWRKSSNYHNRNRVMIEKSPHNVGRIKMLAEEFEDSWFLVQVRNPYVVAEGIRRRMGSKCDIRRAGNHVAKMMELCRQNIEQENQVLAWRYEDLFNKSHIIEKMITDSIVDISDFTFSLEVPSKTMDGYKTMNLTNMNYKQINNLDDKDIDILNSVFRPYIDTLTFFDYGVL